MKLHLDLDCYFVSAERTRCSFLKNKPVAVCKSGDKAIFSNETHSAVITPPAGAFNSIFQLSREYKGFDKHSWKKEFMDESGKIHGIVIAKSYECKAYGIKTGTHISDALIMCPNLIILPSDHLFYQTLSHKLLEYLQTKIPLLEQYSIDEFFGDVGGWIRDEDVPPFIKSLQSEITRIFDLPITIGASKSKWIAKLLTDRIKPYGTKVLYESEVSEYIKDISVEEFCGVGAQTLKKLKSRGVHKIGDIHYVKDMFYSWGKSGRDLYTRMMGVDNEAITPYSDRKSIGLSRNFPPIKDRVEIYRRVTILSRHLAFTINRLHLNPTTFYYKLRYEDYTKNKISFTVDRVFNERDFIDQSIMAIKKLDTFTHAKIRYLTISASNFTNRTIHYQPPHKNTIESKSINLKTYDLFSMPDSHKLKALDSSLCQIRDKWGVDSVRYGCEVMG
jgi:DNA polymerase-4